MEQSVPKRRHIKFRHRGITHKKAHNTYSCAIHLWVHLYFCICRECEYFHMVIRPMLNAGHEGELCEWLKQMGLLRRGLKCSNTNCTGGKMEWSKARVVDKYNWSCTACSKKVSIRDGSFFMPVKCELKVVIQAILSWCERTPVEVAANNLSEYWWLHQSTVRMLQRG